MNLKIKRKFKDGQMIFIQDGNKIREAKIIKLDCISFKYDKINLVYTVQHISNSSHYEILEENISGSIEEAKEKIISAYQIYYFK